MPSLNKIRLSDFISNVIDANRELREEVMHQFPLYCPVCLEKPAFQGLVFDYNTASPATINILFENGNVWSKEIMSLERIEPEQIISSKLRQMWEARTKAP